MILDDSKMQKSADKHLAIGYANAGEGRPALNCVEGWSICTVRSKMHSATYKLASIAVGRCAVCNKNSKGLE